MEKDPRCAGKRKLFCQEHCLFCLLCGNITDSALVRIPHVGDKIDIQELKFNLTNFHRACQDKSRVCGKPSEHTRFLRCCFSEAECVIMCLSTGLYVDV